MRGVQVFEVTELINTEAYVPPMPKDEAALQCVFDMTYEDVMPYLFHVGCQLSDCFVLCLIVSRYGRPIIKP